MMRWGRPISAINTQIWIALFALLATLPVWLSELPLGTDIPQHAAQINLLLDHFSTRIWAQDIYLNYVTPYLLTYFVGALLALFVGTLTSIKILISLSLAGLVLATARLLKSYGCAPQLAIFAIFGLYGFSYQWGFLPFNLSAVFMLLLWAELQESARSQHVNLARCLALALAIVLTHGLAALVMAGTILLLTLIETRLSARLRNYLLALVLLLPILLWQLFENTGVKGFGDGIYFGIHPVSSPYFYYQELSVIYSHHLNGWGRLSGLFPRILGWGNGPVALGAGLALVLLPLLCGYRLNFSRKNMLLVALLVAILLIMPSVINGSLYSAERFSLLFFCLLPLVFTAPAYTNQRLFFGLLLAAALFLVYQSYKARSYDQHMTGLVNAISSMPAEKRALSLSYTYKADGFIAPIYLHSAQWYGVLKNGLVDPNFAATDLQPLRYHHQSVPFATIGNGFDWSPSTYTWADFQGERYAVFIVRGPLDAFTRHTGCALINAAQAPGEWFALYVPAEVGSPCSANPNWQRTSK